MNTFSRVHISKDAIDENGVRAEVKVQTGCANIEEIKSSKSGKAENVIIRVENSEFTMNGWVPNEDPVFKKIQEAQELDQPIEFRIEIVRKKGIDRTIPISELSKGMENAKKNINKAFAAAKLVDDDEWTLSPKMRTRIELDPKENLDPSSLSLDEFTGGEKNQNTSNNSSKNREPFNNIEQPPYKTYNNDGGLNPGSYTAAVPINILGYVITNAKNNEVNFSENEKSKIAKVIISMCNKLQNYMYNETLNTPLLDANSHTRSRSIIFQVIENYYPLEKEIVETKETLIEWSEKVLKKSQGFWDWNLKELEKFV